MIITYYVIATSETDALDQVASEHPPPHYCGTNKKQAILTIQDLRTPAIPPNKFDDAVKALDLYTVSMVSEKCRS